MEGRLLGALRSGLWCPGGRAGAGSLQTVKCSLVLGLFPAQTPCPRHACASGHDGDPVLPPGPPDPGAPQPLLAWLLLPLLLCLLFLLLAAYFCR